MAELGFWNLAQANPGAFALADPNGRDWTRGELLAEANKIAHGLRSLGLETGRLCGAGARELRRDVYQIHLAITQIGMYMTPINNHLTGAEIAFIVQDSRREGLLRVRARFA